MDVLTWNAKSYTERDSFEWDAASDDICVRSYSDTPIPLRDYQLQACDACNPAPGQYRSGVVEMSCGSGKTHVVSELIRRSRAPAVIIVQHAVGVTQMVDHLRKHVGDDVMTLSTARRNWKPSSRTPDIIVMTYHGLVRTTKRMRERESVLESGMDTGLEEVREDYLILMLMNRRFGILVLDEVHGAVSDYFISAGRLQSSTVYGLTGSPIREDDRMSRMAANVGPTLFSYWVTRTVHVAVVTVPIPEEYHTHLKRLKSRTVVEQTYRALNPRKVAALRSVLDDEASKRVILFCDINRGAELLHETVLAGRSLLMTGDMARADRTRILREFSTREEGSCVLVCTRICDASINFPSGCVVVQYHVSSGSRQQEVQRGGRGTRDVAQTTSQMYHLVNRDTEEPEYVERRLQYMQTMDPNLTVKVEYRTPDSPISSVDVEPSARVCVVRVPSVQGRRQSGRDTRRVIMKRIRDHGAG